MFYVVENGDEVFVATEIAGMDVQEFVDTHDTGFTIAAIRLTEVEALAFAQEIAA